MWKDIPGWEGLYEASDDGRIRSLYRITEYYQNGKLRARGFKGRELRKVIQRLRGLYENVSLSKDGVTYTCSVHSLIALTYIGPKPDGCEVCHEDDNGLNNHADNLSYDTHHNNVLDYIARHGKC